MRDRASPRCSYAVLSTPASMSTNELFLIVDMLFSRA